MNDQLILYNGVVSNHSLSPKNTKMLTVCYSMCQRGKPQKINKYCRVLIFLGVLEMDDKILCLSTTQILFWCVEDNWAGRILALRYVNIFWTESICTFYSFSECHIFIDCFIWFHFFGLVIPVIIQSRHLIAFFY